MRILSPKRGPKPAKKRRVIDLKLLQQKDKEYREMLETRIALLKS
jgi:hypothetical protein